MKRACITVLACLFVLCLPLAGCGDDAFRRPASGSVSVEEAMAQLRFPEESLEGDSADLQPEMAADFNYFSNRAEQIDRDRLAACIQPGGAQLLQELEGDEEDAGFLFCSAVRDADDAVRQVSLSGALFFRISDEASVADLPAAPLRCTVNGVTVETSVEHNKLLACGVDGSQESDEYDYQVRFRRDGLVFFASAYLHGDPTSEEIDRTTEPLRRFVARLTDSETRVDLNAVGRPGQAYLDEWAVPALVFPTPQEVLDGLAGEEQQVSDTGWQPWDRGWRGPVDLTQDQIAWTMASGSGLLFDGLDPAKRGVEVTGSAYYNDEGEAQYAFLRVPILPEGEDLEAVGVALYRGETAPDMPLVEGPANHCDFWDIPVETCAVYYAGGAAQPGCSPEYPIYHAVFTVQTWQDPVTVWVQGMCDAAHDADLKMWMAHIVAQVTRNWMNFNLDYLKTEPWQEPEGVSLSEDGALRFEDPELRQTCEALRKAYPSFSPVEGMDYLLLPRPIYTFNYFEEDENGESQGVLRTICGVYVSCEDAQTRPHSWSREDYFGPAVLDYRGLGFDDSTGQPVYPDPEVSFLLLEDGVEEEMRRLFSASYSEEEAAANARLVFSALAEFHESAREEIDGLLLRAGQ